MGLTISPDGDDTYIERIKTDVGEVFADVVIGDEKRPDGFVPRIKIKRWDNECNLSMGLLDLDGSVGYDSGTVGYRKDDVGARFYSRSTVPDPYGLGYFRRPHFGGTEFDIIFYHRPAVDYIDLSITGKGAKLFYQHPLTLQEQWDQGVRQAINVGGSYAVYHDSKKNNKYKSGKMFHIYRPLVTDANGAIIWGSLSQPVSDILRVTVPGEFLVKARYPIIIDPYFGYQSNGASHATIKDIVQAAEAVLGEQAICHSFGAYGSNDLDLYSADSWGKFNLYPSGVSDIPISGFETGLLHWPYDVDGALVIQALSSSQVLSAGTYKLAAWANAFSVAKIDGTSRIEYDAAVGEYSVHDTNVFGFGVWPSGHGWDSGTPSETNRIYSIWINYTAWTTIQKQQNEKLLLGVY